MMHAFHGVFESPPVGVRMCEDPKRGHGTFATRDIAQGEVIFTERPLAASTEGRLRGGGPVCGACMASCASNPWGDRLPHPEKWPARETVACEGGCGLRYCNAFCRRRALREGHRRLCKGMRRGPPDPADGPVRASAYEALEEYCAWALPEAWQGYGHIFMLSVHLLAMLLDEEQATAPGAPRPLAGLCDQLHGAWPLLRAELRDEWPSGELYALARAALDMTEAEVARFGPEYLCDLLAKLMLNCINVRPLSSFAQYMSNSRAERLASGTATLDRLVALALELGQADGPGGPLRSNELDAFFALRTGAHGAGLCLLQCRLNHSCDPNVAVVVGQFTDVTIELTAQRDMRKGEELLQSYVDPALPACQRRQKLWAGYGFWCTCDRCVTGSRAGGGPVPLGAEALSLAA